LHAQQAGYGAAIVYNNGSDVIFPMHGSMYTAHCMIDISVWLKTVLPILKGKGKGQYSSSWEPHLRATGRHLPYGITPDTSEHALPNSSHAGQYLIYLPQRDGRLSWLDSAPAGSRTSDLSITSPTLNQDNHALITLMTITPEVYSSCIQLDALVHNLDTILGI